MKNFASSEYSIEIGSIEKSTFEKLLTETYGHSKIVIIVDENTHDFCLEYMLTTFDFLQEAEVMLLPVGEENKVMEVCFQVLQALGEYEIGRNDIIINLGGGVVTDMGGFIASIYKRGVDFINIPTTLLSQIDASVGGKTGVDLDGMKNMIRFVLTKYNYENLITKIKALDLTKRWRVNISEEKVVRSLEQNERLYQRPGDCMAPRSP